MPFWNAVWDDIRVPLQALVGDAALFLVVLAILAVVYLALLAAKVVGVDPAHLELFETMHYYAYVIVLALLLLDLITKVALFVLEPWKTLFRAVESNDEK